MGATMRPRPMYSSSLATSTGTMIPNPMPSAPSSRCSPVISQSWRRSSGSQSTAKERTPSPPTAAESKSGGSDDSGDDASGDVPAPASTSGSGGKKVTSKTYTFGAMDVEGKLKTPQLLYFLNRVKLELDMSAPDKRSFMKELQQSADDKNL